MKNILIILFIFSNIVFASSFEFDFSVSSGGTFDFSYNEGYSFKKDLDGFRVGSGLSLSILLSLGRNDEINNNILTSISSMIETGYNYYKRERRGNKDYYTDDGYYVYDYHSIILGYLLRLNFHNKVSLGIGGGIFIPLYSTANQADYSFGLIDNYQYMTEFNQKNIAFMYKLPFMPYVKANVVRYFYFSDRWSFKIGGNLIYNFGMELDTYRLGFYNVYDKYNFSYFDIEIYVGISFGRPNK
ncbi:hypothetical protein [Brachyspira pilosicoli]|uniref:hypothetical protein n=1 Tax=Brachyspira pilosicoli TaxID=52584 RepID=UPI0018DEFD03|nr:hypothetical protein [Brachyspira pilosicoli]